MLLVVVADPPKIWSILSLSTTLEVLQTKLLEESPDIALEISHGLQITEYERQTKRSWELDNIDTRPPVSIHCAELEKLQIIFDFLTTKEELRDVTIAEGGPGTDIMLLDIPLEICGDNCSRDLQSPITVWQEPLKLMHTFSGLQEDVEPGEPIAKSVNQTSLLLVGTPTNITQLDLQQFSKDRDNENFSGTTSNTGQPAESITWTKHSLPQPTRDDEFESVIESLQTLPQSIEDCFSLGKGVESGRSTAKLSKRRKFSRDITDTLVAWFESHASKYPTLDEKMLLMSQTGLLKCRLLTSTCFRILVCC